MHFWIDKRSSFGIGHNRSMAGLSYQHRRIRSKSIAPPARQSLPGAPSASLHYAKSPHLHHQRNRHVVVDSRPTSSRLLQRANPGNAVLPSVPCISSQSVPTPTICPREAHSPSIHLIDPTEDTGNDCTDINWTWIPIYLIGGISITSSLTFLILDLYNKNALNVVHILTFGTISIMLLIFTIIRTIVRNRWMRYERGQPEHSNNRANQTVINHPMATQSIEECLDPPPPYAVAVKLPENHIIIDCSPPPSYEKINVI